MLKELAECQNCGKDFYLGIEDEDYRINLKREKKEMLCDECEKV